MSAAKRSDLRLLWLALVLLLPSVYLHEMVPHHHAAPAHTHDGEVPELPGHLPHTHHDDADTDAHHCRLTNHLDSHTFSVPDRGRDFDPALVIAGHGDLPGPPVRGFAAPDPEGRDPDDPPPSPGAPRAPPLQG